MTTTVKMQQIKENAHQCEMTLLEYVKEAMSAEGDQFAKWFLDDDTAELNAETESQILQAVGGVKTMQEILEAAQAKFRHAHVTTDGMAVVARGKKFPNGIVVIPIPDNASSLGVVKPTTLRLKKWVNGARIYKHHKKALWLATKGDWASFFTYAPSESDIEG